MSSSAYQFKSCVAGGSTKASHLLSKEKIIQDRQKYLAKAQYTFYENPLMLVRGDKQYAFDENGRKYLDAYANVAHVGYCHPHVIQATVDQLQFINSNTRYLHDKIVRLAEKLTSKMPQKSDLTVCFFVNSGSEANDLAVRLARVYTERNTIIALENSYHGTTGTSTGISASISTGTGDKCPDWDYYARDVEYVRMPDMLRSPYKPERAIEEYVKDFDRAFEKRTKKVCPSSSSSCQSSPKQHDIAAFIHESIQGVGGQLPFPDGYLQQVYAKVKGRGDIVTMGKPFGNGHPLGCVVTTRKIAEAFDKSQYFNTFGGNPVSCAVGLAVMEVIENENLQQNSLEVGTFLKDGLSKLMKKHKLIGDVRGRGLFLGVELVKNAHIGDLTPAVQETKYVWERTKELGVLIGSGGPHKNVLRIKGPVCLTKEDAQFLIDCVDQALTEAENKDLSSQKGFAKTSKL
ncbi:hypothetical protein C9374_002503 [Naegleria lovaniensis]|uniref:alanine--glyoxylate transaminase n=1 Tax=Naegleria lovaniensis TaxID=51637 RepID=A0AA88GV71_NAELO|nr:uncharacterized protein C9374_002503 [Naegleria lovaniensis]KAG2386759.1 hypothetical protein C9374_002503 [Naegleria lovaniensis]